jgi:hypothetical protein
MFYRSRPYFRPMRLQRLYALVRGARGPAKVLPDQGRALARCRALASGEVDARRRAALGHGRGREHALNALRSLLDRRAKGRLPERGCATGDGLMEKKRCCASGGHLDRASVPL